MRITGHDGNVVTADFRPSLEISIKTAILYADDAVALMRVTYAFNGAEHHSDHFMVEL